MAKVELTPGKLYRVNQPTRFVKVPSTDFADMEDWPFELQSIASEDILMIVKVSRGESKRRPYLKVFCLCDEQLLYIGDHENEVRSVFRLASC